MVLSKAKEEKRSVSFIALSIEEENALVRYMWDIEREEDKKYIESVVEKKLFQLCVFCSCFPVRDCSVHGCFLLRKGDFNVLRRCHTLK